MNSYVVFFTEGFDDYTIQKQCKILEDDYVSCIKSFPDYDRLLLEGQKALDENFDSFYILWEKDDIENMTSEMKDEFPQFLDTGAIPYSFNKLIENDLLPSYMYEAVGNQVNNPGGTPTPTPTPNPAGNMGGRIAEPKRDVNDTGIVDEFTPKRVSSTTDTPDSAGSILYTKDHKATIFIWPFNIFSPHGSTTKNDLQSMEIEMMQDNVSRVHNAYVTANTNSTKKGNWQRILYIPPSLKEFHQGVANGGTMWKFTQDAYSKVPFSDTPTAKAYDHFLKRVVNVGGTKLAFGGLTETDILRACANAGAVGATRKNIHVFFPASYEKYFEWLPIKNRSKMSRLTSEPPIDVNQRYMQQLGYLDNFVTEFTKNAPSPNRINNSLYLKDIKDFAEGSPEGRALISRLIGNLNNIIYYPLWEFLNIYKEHYRVYDPPTGSEGLGGSAVSDSWSETLDKAREWAAGDHINDLDWLKRMMGVLPANRSSSEDTIGKSWERMKKKWGARKDAVGIIGNNIKTTAHNVKNKVKSHSNSDSSSENPKETPNSEATNTDFDDRIKDDNKNKDPEIIKEDILSRWLNRHLFETEEKPEEGENPPKDSPEDLSSEKPVEAKEGDSVEKANPAQNEELSLMFNNNENIFHLAVAFSPVWQNLVERNFYANVLTPKSIDPNAKKPAGSAGKFFTTIQSEVANIKTKYEVYLQNIPHTEGKDGSTKGEEMSEKK